MHLISLRFIWLLDLKISSEIVVTALQAHLMRPQQKSVRQIDTAPRIRECLDCGIDLFRFYLLKVRHDSWGFTLLKTCTSLHQPSERGLFCICLFEGLKCLSLRGQKHICMMRLCIRAYTFSFKLSEWGISAIGSASVNVIFLMIFFFCFISNPLPCKWEVLQLEDEANASSILKCDVNWRPLDAGAKKKILVLPWLTGVIDRSHGSSAALSSSWTSTASAYISLQFYPESFTVTVFRSFKIHCFTFKTGLLCFTNYIYLEKAICILLIMSLAVFFFFALGQKYPSCKNRGLQALYCI